MRASSPNELEKFVNNELAHGWRATGGLAVLVLPANNVDGVRTILMQAMIHEGQPT